MKTIEKFTGKINPRYDLTIDQIWMLWEENTRPADLIANSFTFGYAQGYKAKTAELKRKAAKNENKRI